MRSPQCVGTAIGAQHATALVRWALLVGAGVKRRIELEQFRRRSWSNRSGDGMRAEWCLNLR